MHTILQRYARSYLKLNLGQLYVGQQELFKRLYGMALTTKGQRIEEINIDDVVDMMESDKLDWAMKQVDGTLKTLEKYPILPCKP